MRLFALFSFLALFALPATAQGIVLESVRIDPPRRPTPVRPMAMRLTEHRVKIAIENQVARTDVVQVFHNPNPWPIEGVYLFPLPPGAAVSDFTMSMGGKQITGEILDAKRASDIYRSIVSRRDDPGLLEYAGRRAIRARLFPIPARSDTKVTLSFGQVLPTVGGMIEMTYPMRSQAFRHGRVKMAGEIDIRAPQGILNLYCPTHALDVVHKSDTHVAASFEEVSADPSRDLQLLYTLGNREFGLSLSTHKPLGDDGYFLMLLAPRTSGKRVQPLPKDVVFALDTSGSMGDRGGRKMAQAKRALGYALGRLRPQDRFNIVTFATEARPYRDALVAATPENIAAAVKHVEGLVATGGTAMHDALVQSLAVGRSEGRVPIVIFLTDGQPTIGPVVPKEIHTAAGRSNRAEARLFVFGVGYDVNTQLLNDLADTHRGTASYVTEKEDIERKVSTLVDRVASPVLTDVAVTIDGLEARDIYPQRIGDLFAGQQVVLAGRYRGKGAHAIRLRGKLGKDEVHFVYEANFGDQPGQTFLPKLWAVRRVGFLLSQMRRNGESTELADEVRRLGTRYGIVTPYTSFLVVEEGELARRRLDRARRGRPAGGAPSAPEVRRLENAVDELRKQAEEARGASAAYDDGETSGRGAVHFASRLGKMKGAQRAAGMTGRGVRLVDGKTFRFFEGVWHEVSLLTTPDIDPPPAVKVRYLSDEYMKLLENDQLARWLSVGPELRLLHDGKLYVISRRP
ncbi:MAG: VIT and VWA domain-containing protein [Planctomycetota bacterium]